MFSAVASSEAASYQAAVAQNNAQIAQQNAIYAKQAGAAKTEQAGLQSAEQVGAVKTSLAANNVDVNTGSALDVETGTREKGVLNEYTIENNADLQAYGYRGQASNFEAQAGLDKATATDDLVGGALNTAGSLLSNASSVGTKYGTGIFNWTGGGASNSNGGIGSDYAASARNGVAVG